MKLDSSLINKINRIVWEINALLPEGLHAEVILADDEDKPEMTIDSTTYWTPEGRIQ